MLKSKLVHHGIGVPSTRALVRTALRTADLDHDGVIELAEEPWSPAGDLGAGDGGFLEGVLDQARTWALVRPLAGDAVGPMCERDAQSAPMLER